MGYPSPQGKEFDWERAIAGLTGGPSAIAALDNSRLAREREKRTAAAEDFDLGEKQFAAPFKRTQLDLQTQGMADENEGRRMKLDTQRAEHDPGSEYSKQMKRSLAAQFRAYAGALQQRGAPETAMFADAADKIERNTDLGASQILEAAKPLAEAAGFNLKALHDQATESMSKAQLGLSQAQFGETRRMHDAQIDNIKADNARAFDVSVKKPQEKLNQEINNLETSKAEMEELLKKKEKVNTGPVSAFFLNTLGLGKLDELTTEDRKDLRALTARVFNKETKTLAGTAVSEAEWARIAPQIPEERDDDETYNIKLQRALKEADRILQARRREYQRTPQGTPIDSSVTAAEANAQAKPKMTAQEREVLIWYNDPANKEDPRHKAVGDKLRAKGFIK